MSALFGLLLLATSHDALAVPSFARQSGMDCTTCHMSWLELTSVGRRFKLGGYQLTKNMSDDAKRPLLSMSFADEPPLIPVAGMIQASVTHTQNTGTAGTDKAADFPKENTVLLQQASLFLNGKLADHVGCFCQWTYDGAAHRSSIDNAEVRIADEYSGDGLQALYGLSINNSPTMSDIYNTTPVWGWPYAGSTVAPAPSASTIINGGLAQQVIGLSAYSLVNKMVYAELGAYRTADKAYSIMRAGLATEDRSVIKNGAPYFRLALQNDWDKGRQSGMVGLFGLSVDKYPDNTQPFGATDKFRDQGIDAQYQYITDANRISVMGTYIRERQNLAATFAGGGSSNPDNTLKQLNLKASYYMDKWYGISVGYQRTNGSSDAGLYDTGSALTGSVAANPNSTAKIIELNWLFSPTGAETHRTNRLVLQYTSYSKFNGGTTNYDGFGRNARDNNTLYLLGWFLF
jgi:hypothetical protein